MMARSLTFLPCGDTALCVEFGNRVERQLCLEVVALKEAVQAAQLPGVVECVPTYRSLLVHYNPLQTGGEELQSSLRELAAAGTTTGRTATRWLLPLCCDDAFAWDLEELCATVNLGRAEVEAALFDTELFIYMIGFTMGLLYFGDFPQFEQLSRRTEPRIRLDAGAVGVAQGSGVIYPVASPGGWNVLGNTPAPLFDVMDAPPSPFTPGDTIRFQRVDAAEHARIVRAVAGGGYRLEREAAP